MSSFDKPSLQVAAAALCMLGYAALDGQRALKLCCITMLIYRVAVVIRRVFFHPLSSVPGPLSFAASYLPYTYYNHIQGTLYRQMPDLHQKYGPMIRIGPDHIAVDGSLGWPEVCAYRGENGQDREFGKMPGLLPNDKEGLLVAPKESHRKQRRLLIQGFSNQAIGKQEQLISQYADKLMLHLANKAEDGQLVDVVDWMNFTLFDIVGELTFSESFGCLDKGGYHPWVKMIFQGIRALAFLQICQDYPLLGYIIDLVGMGATSKKAAEVRAYIEDKTSTRLEFEHKGVAERPERMSRDFISFMLRRPRDGGEAVTLSEIYASIGTLVVAGSETTATAISAFFFYVAQNKSAYELLAREVRGAFANESEINFRSAAELEYLGAVIWETCRVFPPAAENPVRVSPGASVDGVFIPNKTRVSIYQWSTFRNPKHFVHHDAFIPERWLRETHPLYQARFASDRRDLVRPWSAGPRDCFGKNLALAEMRLLISKIVFRFDFTLPLPQTEWHKRMRTFLLWEKGPLQVLFTERKPL